MVAFRIPRPKSHLRAGGELRASAPERPVGKPDIDNLVKAVLDALGKWDGRPALLWRDDAQVVEIVASKRYATPGEATGATIVVERVPACAAPAGVV